MILPLSRPVRLNGNEAGLSAPDDQNTLKAALWMIGAIFSFTSMAIAGRVILPQLDTFELMTYRSLIGIMIVLVVGGFFGTLKHIRADRLPMHIGRNAFHFAGQNLWFAAITLAPLSTVIALEFTTPIWVVLLAPLFLDEKLTRLRMLVAVLGFTGSLMVARPDFSNPEFGVIFAAMAAIGFAATAIFTKRLTRHEKITSILFWLTFFQAIFGLVTAGWDGDFAWPTPDIWPWVILVACAGLCAHLCLTMALGLAPAVVVMPVDFVRLPVIILVGYLLYSEPLELWVGLGAALILGANYLNIRSETRT